MPLRITALSRPTAEAKYPRARKPWSNEVSPALPTNSASPTLNVGVLRLKACEQIYSAGGLLRWALARDDFFTSQFSAAPRRYWIASATWADWISVAPSRSAMVRASLRMR
jgi:hypothetical protein